MKTGEIVPEFELPDETGTPRSLTSLLEDGPVVLFFYPAAMTSGCTKEACHFRDLAAEFAEVGAQRVGISLDKVDKQKQFAEKHGFDYPLLSDADGTVAKMFGVKRQVSLLKVKRHTFVIDTDRTLLAEISSETNMDKHADQALDLLRSRAA
ncbi:MAG: peroxiredoxin [Acidimicrobiales bacterium]